MIVIEITSKLPPLVNVSAYKMCQNESVVGYVDMAITRFLEVLIVVVWSFTVKSNNLIRNLSKMFLRKFVLTSMFLFPIKLPAAASIINSLWFNKLVRYNSVDFALSEQCNCKLESFSR